MKRRNFLRTTGVTVLAAMAANRLIACNSANPDIDEPNKPDNGEKSKVFFTTDISPAGVMLAYNALEKTLPGNAAVKVSTGEPGGHHFLVVECNTAYGGQRASTVCYGLTAEIGKKSSKKS
jgi:uncharacterized Fe-S center protein